MFDPLPRDQGWKKKWLWEVARFISLHASFNISNHSCFNLYFFFYLKKTHCRPSRETGCWRQSRKSDLCASPHLRGTEDTCNLHNQSSPGHQWVDSKRPTKQVAAGNIDEYNSKNNTSQATLAKQTWRETLHESARTSPRFSTRIPDTHTPGQTRPRNSITPPLLPSSGLRGSYFLSLFQNLWSLELNWQAAHQTHCSGNPFGNILKQI